MLLRCVMICPGSLLCVGDLNWTTLRCVRGVWGLDHDVVWGRSGPGCVGGCAWPGLRSFPISGSLSICICVYLHAFRRHCRG